MSNYAPLKRELVCLLIAPPPPLQRKFVCLLIPPPPKINWFAPQLPPKMVPGAAANLDSADGRAPH